MMYVKHPLTLPNVDDLLFEFGIDIPAPSSSPVRMKLRLGGPARKLLRDAPGREFGATGKAHEATEGVRRRYPNEVEAATLQLDPQQYQEGVFCWKAFLYYKWQLADLLPRVSSVLAEIEAKRPRGQITDETKTYLTSARDNIGRELKRSCQKVKATLAIYDAAYHGLTAGAEPRKFRDFLLQAPSLFSELGERLGGIEHIISFWRYRFASGRPSAISPDDLVDMFMDFEGSLSTEPAASAGGASRIVSPPLAA
jgi:hypothetical protein